MTEHVLQLILIFSVWFPWIYTKNI